jgi:hypothetical protein
LRKLKRLELAWITAPCISLLFATFFYLFTMNLYKAGLSRRTSGIMMAAANDPNARLYASTECFFPRGGNFDIIIPGAESLEPDSPNSNSYNARNDRDYLNTIDDGMVRLLGYRTGNLAYRRFCYEAPVMLNGALDVKLADVNGGLSGQISNNTQLDLKDCHLYIPSGNMEIKLGDLNSGQSVQLIKQAFVAGVLTNNPCANALNYDSKDAALIAKTNGATFGPSIGSYVGGADSLDVIVSVNIKR